MLQELHLFFIYQLDTINCSNFILFYFKFYFSAGHKKTSGELFKFTPRFPVKLYLKMEQQYQVIEV